MERKRVTLPGLSRADDPPVLARPWHRWLRGLYHAMAALWRRGYARPDQGDGEHPFDAEDYEAVWATLYDQTVASCRRQRQRQRLKSL